MLIVCEVSASRYDHLAPVCTFVSGRPQSRKLGAIFIGHPANSVSKMNLKMFLHCGKADNLTGRDLLLLHGSLRVL